MRFALLGLSLLLTACHTPCPPAPREPEQRVFHCEDGSDIAVTFDSRPGFASVEQEGFAPLDLPNDVIAAGFRYAAGGAELRGQGRQATWQRPGSAETVCRENPPAGAQPAPQALP